MNHYECGNLFRASKRLLEGSGLVRYSNDTLVCNSDERGLEKWWRENLDQEFGRYMAWVWFSVGAENLVKAALVCNGLLEQKRRIPDTRSTGETRTKGNGSTRFCNRGEDQEEGIRL